MLTGCVQQVAGQAEGVLASSAQRQSLVLCHRAKEKDANAPSAHSADDWTGAALSSTCLHLPACLYAPLPAAPTWSGGARTATRGRVDHKSLPIDTPIKTCVLTCSCGALSSQHESIALSCIYGKCKNSKDQRAESHIAATAAAPSP